MNQHLDHHEEIEDTDLGPDENVGEMVDINDLLKEYDKRIDEINLMEGKMRELVSRKANELNLKVAIWRNLAKRGNMSEEQRLLFDKIEAKMVQLRQSFGLPDDTEYWQFYDKPDTSEAYRDDFGDKEDLPKAKEYFYGVLLPEIPFERRIALLKKYKAVEYIRETSDEERIEKSKKASLLTEQTGSVHQYDNETTDNILRSNTHDQLNKRLEPEPLIAFYVEGRDKPIIARAEIAIRFMAADEDMFAASGHHIILVYEGKHSGRSHFRENEYQEKAYNNYLGGGGLAAKPYRSSHEFGAAFDVANWKRSQPYLKSYGFIGGFESGLHNDQVHFDIGRIKEPVSEEEQQVLRKERELRLGIGK